MPESCRTLVSSRQDQLVWISWGIPDNAYDLWRRNPNSRFILRDTLVPSPKSAERKIAYPTNDLFNSSGDKMDTGETYATPEQVAEATREQAVDCIVRLEAEATTFHTSWAGMLCTSWPFRQTACTDIQTFYLSLLQPFIEEWHCATTMETRPRQQRMGGTDVAEIGWTTETSGTKVRIAANNCWEGSPIPLKKLKETNDMILFVWPRH